MTVKELIIEMEKLDPKMQVMVRGYEGGYNEVKKISMLEVVEQEEKLWWYGDYDLACDSNDSENKLTVIYISN